MATFRVETEDLKKLVRSFNETLDKLKDLKPAMEEIGQELSLRVDDSFESETDPWGSSWQSHSPTTLSMRETRLGKKGSTNAKLLQDRGLLRKSIKAKAGRNEATIGVTGPASKYAPAQQFGNRQNRLPRSRGLNPIPARPFLPISPTGEPNLPKPLASSIARILIDYLTEVFKDSK